MFASCECPHTTLEFYIYIYSEDDSREISYRSAEVGLDGEGKNLASYLTTMR